MIRGVHFVQWTPVQPLDPKWLLMLFQGPGENEDIIKIYKYKLFKQILQHFIYEGLEDC